MFREPAIAYGNGQYFAASVSNIVTSTDETNWTAHHWSGPYTLQQIVFGSGQFMGLGWDNSTGGYILSSADGTNWTLRFSSPFSFSSIAYAAGQFVAVGGMVSPPDAPFEKSAAYIVTSPDGTQWHQQQSPTTNFLSGVTYGKGRFVAVGYTLGDWKEGGSVISSADGTNWVLATPTVTVHSIAYGNGQFVAMGDNGAVLTSSDGANWTPRTLAGPWWHYGPWSLTYGNGHFVMVAFATPSSEMWGAGAALGIWEPSSIINLVATRQASTGRVTLSLEGPIAMNYTIQSSADLVTWTTLTNFASTQTTQVISAPAPSSERAFYRAYAF